MDYTTFIYSVLDKRNQRMAKSATPEQKLKAQERLAELESMNLTGFHVERGQEKRNLKAIIES